MLYYVLTLYISVGHVVSMALSIITKYKCYSVSTGHVSYLISHQWKIHFSEFPVTSVNVKNTSAKMLQKPYNFCPFWHMWWFWCYWVNFISGKTNLISQSGSTGLCTEIFVWCSSQHWSSIQCQWNNDSTLFILAFICWKPKSIAWFVWTSIIIIELVSNHHHFSRSKKRFQWTSDITMVTRNSPNL